MKVLVVGAKKAPAIESYFVRHLNTLGAETRHFAAQNIFFDHYERNIVSKILFKAGLSPIYRKINRLFLEEVKDFRPDIVWVFKGMEIFPESLVKVKEMGIRLVNYNTDNPFLFSGKGSGNANVVRSLDLYDLHLSYDPGIRKRIIEETGIRCELLPFSFEEDPALYERCVTQQEDPRICFVGSPDKDRTAFLEKIADEVPLVVYGPGWDTFTRHPQITIYPAVHKDDYWKTLYRFRAQLNLMRPHNPDSHNMRSFEVPGIGGIMLAPDTADHRRYFEDGKEIFLYAGAEDCIAKARSLLQMTPPQARTIRTAARSRSMELGYSYMGRTTQVYKWFQELT